MKTYGFILSGGLAAAAFAAPTAAARGLSADKAPRPNVVLLVADDCSWFNIGCFGAVDNRTPNIDSLAAAGVRMTNVYNSVSISVPTRHCLYTGMYPIRHGGYPNHSRIRDGIPTMPVLLGELGYRVGLAGKWHVHPEAMFPFEEVKGFPKNCLTKNPVHTMEGVDEFVTRDREQPFCLVVASVNPHAPWTGGDHVKYDRSALTLPPIFADTPETRDAYAHYLAEIDLLDREVGDVVNLLKSRGLYDDTLIIFISEQGTQLAGAKWTNWHAGVHAAMTATWPGHIAPGSVCDAVVQYEDILPTLITLAGGTPGEDMDGSDITPLLTGRRERHRKYAFSLHSNIPSGPAYQIRSVSDGRYRLIWNLTHERTYVAKSIEGAAWFRSWQQAGDPHARFIMERWRHRPEIELYDIEADPYELHNLCGDKRLARVESRLLRALKRWMEEQHDPGRDADVSPTASLTLQK